MLRLWGNAQLWPRQPAPGKAASPECGFVKLGETRLSGPYFLLSADRGDVDSAYYRGVVTVQG